MVGEEAGGEAEEESAMMERSQPVLTDQHLCSMVTGQLPLARTGLESQ